MTESLPPSTERKLKFADIPSRYIVGAFIAGLLVEGIGSGVTSAIKGEDIPRPVAVLTVDCKDAPKSVNAFEQTTLTIYHLLDHKKVVVLDLVTESHRRSVQIEKARGLRGYTFNHYELDAESAGAVLYVMPGAKLVAGSPHNIGHDSFYFDKADTTVSLVCNEEFMKEVDPPLPTTSPSPSPTSSSPVDTVSV